MRLIPSLVLAVALLVTLEAGGTAATPNPKKAAAVLVARLKAASKRAHIGAFGWSEVISRNGRLWLAFGTTPSGAPYLGGSGAPGRVRIYQWVNEAWRIRGIVRGNLAPTQWIKAASLTGSRDPDFSIEGCGAGDTNCLSIVSDVGGRWHAVPFEYGYGRTIEVNGFVRGSLIMTAVDACSCASGPSTWTFERYQSGVFRPTEPPGPSPECNAAALSNAAHSWAVKVLRFDHVACAAGWALAVGTGAGFDGPVVGLFDRAMHPARWAALTIDNGLALPAAPAIFDLPLSLLIRLAGKVGLTLAPHTAAAKLIAHLQSDLRFYWPQQNGLVKAHGALWLIAVVPAGRAANGWSPFPARAVIYRWNGRSWTIRGRVAHLPKELNLAWHGGWFTSAPAGDPSAVAFAHGKRIITNAGGPWHVELAS